MRIDDYRLTYMGDGRIEVAHVRHPRSKTVYKFTGERFQYEKMYDFEELNEVSKINPNQSLRYVQDALHYARMYNCYLLEHPVRKYEITFRGKVLFSFRIKHFFKTRREKMRYFARFGKEPERILKSWTDIGEQME